MYRVVFFISALVVICFSDSTLECPDNEIAVQCEADCPSDHCPTSEYESTASCPKPDVCPPDSCKCRFNYRRAKNGTCIPTRDCPPFKCHGKNQNYNACPPICPGDGCEYAPYGGQCPPRFGNIGIVLPCSPKCRCAKGFYKNSSGNCVLAKYCPSMQNNNSS